MSAVSLILLLLAASAALDILSGKLGVPHPVLLVLAGLVLAVTPGLPRATLDPDIVFLIFVPPLLYWAALTTSWRDFRRSLRSITLLAVGLVAATIVAVAGVSHATADLTWPVAFVLGAIVAPPDAVATVAVTRDLRVPKEITTLLEGESLVNDATALVAYRIAVDATVSGHFSLSSAAVQFVIAGLGGIAVGLGIGVAIAWLRRRLPQVPEVENTISLLTPFATYIPAYHLGLSGVLAVVTVGLYLGRQGPRLLSPATRIEAVSMWKMVTYLLEGLIFILIGLDLPIVTRGLAAHSLSKAIWYGVIVSATTIAVRLAWTFPGAYVPRLIDRWLGKPTDFPPPANVLFVGWAGMRGADSLVIALALPLTTAAGAPFSARDLVIFITFTVILVTLVLQGLTLRPVIRLLGLRGDETDEREATEARLRTAEAGMERLDDIIERRTDLVETARSLRARHRHRIHRYKARQQQRTHQRDESAAAAYRAVRKEMIDAERDQLIRLRDDGVISDDVMRRIQRDLDLEQLLLESTGSTLESHDHENGDRD
jgi:CPA1 family monovalent cation:H+ antiporter